MTSKPSATFSERTWELLEALLSYANSPSKDGAKHCRALIDAALIEVKDERSKRFLEDAYGMVARPYVRAGADLRNLVETFQCLAVRAEIINRHLVLHLVDGTTHELDLDEWASFSAASDEDLNDYVLVSGGREVRWPSLNEHIHVLNLVGEPVEWNDTSILEILKSESAPPTIHDGEREYWSRGCHLDGRLLRTVRVQPRYPSILCEMDNGTKYELDMSWAWAPGKSGPIGEPLKNKEYFDKVFVSEFGEVTWPNGFDLAPEYPARDGKLVNE